MRHAENKGLWIAFLLLIVACGGLVTVSAQGAPPVISAEGDYVVLAWNDLGMHCYNPDFDDIGVLPPWNTLWAQVVRIGDPPQVVTTGITVTFYFSDNTESVSKSNFWATNPHTTGQNAQLLFGLAQPLTPNIGLTGVGLAGVMHAEDDHFVAEGIPLTEYQDSASTTPYPYQLATIVVQQAGTGDELARAVVVAPVSTEMHCDNCHFDNGPGNEDFAYGVVERNILAKHDEENSEDYPFQGTLMDHRPVLCADCHASNALNKDGIPDVPNLSKALHDKHDEKVPNTLTGCYNCHPGPQTQCLRDVMATEYDMDCVDCHGTMQDVAENPDPWLNEPRCDSAGCHGNAYPQDQALYRMSRDHGGVYCAACHDSPHAIAPSSEANDAIKFFAWQGHEGPVDTCIVCHATWPLDPGPHGITKPPACDFIFQPDLSSLTRPGQYAIYLHTLQNTGCTTDTYDLDWNSSQGWAKVTVSVSPTTLLPGEQAFVAVTISVPNTTTVKGLVDTTTITATSQLSPTRQHSVVDTTTVPVAQIYLPIILRLAGPQ